MYGFPHDMKPEHKKRRIQKNLTVCMRFTIAIQTIHKVASNDSILCAVVVVARELEK